MTHTASEERRAHKIAAQVFTASGADQTEAVLIQRHSALTRFAASTIHQNTADTAWELRVRCVVGRRVGCAVTNDISRDGVARATSAAERIARHQQERPRPVQLPRPASYRQVCAYSKATESLTPRRRAQAVRTIIRVCNDAGLEPFGSFSQLAASITVANTHGVWAHTRATQVIVNVLATGPDSSGWAQFWGYDVARLDPQALANDAVRRALSSANPIAVEPGPYTVILEADAVSEMLNMLALTGLGARSFLEGRSFMIGRLGQRICGENITLRDDAFEPENPGLPFDFEGTPKQAVDLIRRGIACGVVWDTETAAEAGGDQRSTGHALVSPNTFGPYPLNLLLEPGDSSLEQMVKTAERALLVTRFHYTNIAHPLRTLITGMTRDGTFLIEGGQIVRGVRNLRFTQSVLEALSNVEAISSERQVRNGYLAPHLKVSGFHFTGVTEH